MIVERIIYVVFGVMLLAGSVGAVDLTASNISTSNTGWLTATSDGSSQSIITVYALNSSASPPGVSGAIVDFSLDPASAGMGTFFPASVTTGSEGKATAVFSTGKKSGTAVIRATISYSDGTTTPVTVQTNQKIDHSVPQYANYSFLPSVTVGTITPISVLLTDQFNNPVDSNNPSGGHLVTLATTSSPGGEGFQNGSLFVDHIVLAPDAAGRVSASYRVSSIAGKNYIMLLPLGNINDPPQYITGTGLTMPAFITQTFPLPNTLPADADPSHYFTIDYTVTDVYGNPVNTTLLFTADDGTSSVKVTNPVTGKVRARFGPKDIIGVYTLRGSTPANASVVCLNDGSSGNCNQTVEYYNTDPVDISITANPQGMASLDVDGSSRAVIRAKVVDIKGNPVTGQQVNFTAATPTHPGGPYNVTIPLALSATSAKVADGYATVNFTPEAFTSYENPGYNSTATGEVVVSATWYNKSGSLFTRNVTLVWKNYPYLSISSEGTCTNSKVGDMINVTIELAGDGAALRPKPISAIMLMDNSGSMSQAPKMSGPNGTQYKIYYSRVAGRTFVDKMNNATDQVGLTAFNASAAVQYHLSGNFIGVKNAFGSLAGNGNTNTRTGLKLAIDDMITYSTNPKAIKAIILMTDGAFNTDGDPLARGTAHSSEGNWGDGSTDYYTFPAPFTGTQNLAQNASAHGIVIYTVTFGLAADQYNSSATYNAMDLISSQTGGIHFHANDGAQAIAIYETIAGLLQDTAGGNTNVDLDFGTININDKLDANITDYMNYTYVYNATLGYRPSDSTYANKTKLNTDGSITLQSQGIQDDTSNWSAHKMKFDVGTIKLNETWTTNFRLNLTKAGKIELFGPTSISNITFKDLTSNSTQTAFIPAIQCNVLQSRPGGKGDFNLSVFDLTDSLGAGATIATQWPIEWKTTYDGNATAVDQVKYRDASYGTDWQSVDYGWAFFGANTYAQVQYLTIPTSDDVKWPPGNQFCIQVTGTADDVNGEAKTLEICRYKQGSGAGQYIKLE